MLRPINLLFVLCSGWIAAAGAAEVFNQNFTSSTNYLNYMAAAPNSGQFNDISAKATGGTWSINASNQLQLVRVGSATSTNGAGITRSTDFAVSPTVLTVKFDFGVSVSSFQNDLMGLEIGSFSSVTDYNTGSSNAAVFTRLNIDGTGANTFKFEIGGVQSPAYAANGSLYTVTMFLNKSGATQIYLAPDGTVKQVDANKLSLWVGTSCLFPNVAAANGASSALTDWRARLATADTGTWKFDNVVVNNSFPQPVSGKLVLNASMLTNESAIGDASLLIDEQGTAGDPVGAPPGGVPVTKFVPPVGNAQSWYYPLNTIIDLGANHQLTHICFYDSNGTGNLTISTGTPFNWTTAVSDGQNSFNAWRVFPVNVNTRYVQVSIASLSATPPEILLYGVQTGPFGPPPPAPVAQALLPMDQFMGTNTFTSEPIHRQQVVGFLREYHDWAWLEGHTQTTYPGFPNNQNGFAPAWTSANYDIAYKNLQLAGMEVSPAIQKNVLWLTGNNSSLSGTKPILINSGRSPVAPASYIEHADHLFQFAARYGTQVVADSLLKLRSDNARLSGLNRLHYFENWNEPDKWWESRASYFTPYEYAAMSSADGDGHLGAMGATLGVRQADPSAKLVMAGLAGVNLNYLKALKLWCDYNRGGDFAWDVINFHHLSNNGGAQFTGTSGISPEDANAKGVLEAVRQYRDQYLPGVELWVSEFGYDVNQASKQHAPPIGTFTAEEVQAQWILRSYLAYAAAGVDRAIVYTLADQAPVTVGGIYNTCGLLLEKNANYAPRESWWYTYTMRNRLAGLRFDAEQASGNPNVLIYRFKNAAGVVKAYAVWCPTSNQTTVNNYQLTLQGTPTSAAVVNLQVNDPDGVRTPLTINAGKVVVNVSERPIFVLIDNNDPDFVMSTKLNLDNAIVTNESGLGNADLIIDERNTTAGDPREQGGAGAPTTIWAPGNVTASAYINLMQSRFIDRIFIRDMSAVGNLTIEVGSPGNWTPLVVDPLDKYQAWNMHVVNTTTQYIRFTRANGNSNFSEVVLYGK